MINRVTLLGHVGQAPEIRQVGDKRVASFSLATTEKYLKDGVKHENTEWHNIVIWGRLAEIVEAYVHKGSKLYLEGKIKTETYDKDNIKRYTTKIICNQMQLLDSKSGGATPTAAASAAPIQDVESQAIEPIPGEDGLPF